MVGVEVWVGVSVRVTPLARAGRQEGSEGASEGVGGAVGRGGLVGEGKASAAL